MPQSHPSPPAATSTPGPSSLCSLPGTLVASQAAPTHTLCRISVPRPCQGLTPCAQRHVTAAEHWAGLGLGARAYRGPSEKQRRFEKHSQTREHARDKGTGRKPAQRLRDTGRVRGGGGLCPGASLRSLLLRLLRWNLGPGRRQGLGVNGFRQPVCGFFMYNAVPQGQAQGVPRLS